MEYKDDKTELRSIIKRIYNHCAKTVDSNSDNRVNFSQLQHGWPKLTQEQRDNYGNILELTNSIKHYGETSPIQYDINEFSDELLSIKVNKLDGWIQFFGEAQYLLTFHCKDNSRRHFLIRDDDPELKSLLESLNTLTPTEHIEPVRLRKTARNTPNLFFTKPGWDASWDSKQHFKYYNEISDPLMEAAFKKTVCTQENRSRSLTIMDIGAGKGRLAEKLIKMAIEHDIHITYICVEPGKEQCDLATKKLEALAHQMDENAFSFVVINSTLEQLPSIEPELFNKLSGEVDAVISSGGALNYQVIPTGKDALANLQRMQELLKSSGLILMTGLSPLSVTKKEIAATGLKLVSANFDDSRKEAYCYVYTKPEEPEYNEAHRPPV